MVLIGGNIPGVTQVSSQYIQQQIEIDRPLNAAAVSVALLLVAFVVLLLLRLLAGAQLRREEKAPGLGTGARLTARSIALAYLGVLVVLPVAVILWRAFGEGIGAFVASVTTRRRSPPSTCPC